MDQKYFKVEKEEAHSKADAYMFCIKGQKMHTAS